MPTLEATVILKQDGVDLVDTPIIARLFTRDVGSFNQALATGGGFGQLGGFATVNVLLFRTLDETVTIRLDGQSDAGIEIGPAGFVLVFGGTINAGTATNLKVQNASGLPTQVEGILGGAV